MKLKVLTTCSDLVNPGWVELRKSLCQFGWDFEVIQHPFAFGKQLPVIADHLRKGTNCTHILYTDAWDTLALAGPDEVLEKLPDCEMLISTEKACYPLAELAEQYPPAPFEWKYVNGGGWLVRVEFFLDLARDFNLNPKDSHDQLWLHEVYLKTREEGGIMLDTECKIFQTIAFEGPDDFIFQHYQDYYRLYNRKADSLPVFIHGNGHTDMSKVYKLLK